MFLLALLSLSLPITGFAAPHHHRRNTSFSGVDLQALIPPNMAITLPTSNVIAATVGCGTQNYTCTGAGNYSSTGALAQLYDISGLFGGPEFVDISTCALDVWSADTGDTNPFGSQLDTLISNHFGLQDVAKHEFDQFDGSADPKFDFTQSQNNSNDFIIATKTASLPSPNDPNNDVSWLTLQSVSGLFASSAARLFTSGGQPPSSCQPGSGDIAVKYCANYFFFS